MMDKVSKKKIVSVNFRHAVFSLLDFLTFEAGIHSINFVHLMLYVMFYGDMIDVDWYIIRGIACMLSILQYHYIG
jgi:hypothetical protein